MESFSFWETHGCLDRWVAHHWLSEGEIHLGMHLSWLLLPQDQGLYPRVQFAMSFWGQASQLVQQ